MRGRLWDELRKGDHLMLENAPFGFELELEAEAQ